MCDTLEGLLYIWQVLIFTLYSFFLLTTSCIIPTLLESTETGCPILAGSYLGYLCTLFPKYVMPSDLPRWKVLLDILSSSIEILKMCDAVCASKKGPKRHRKHRVGTRVTQEQLPP